MAMLVKFQLWCWKTKWPSWLTLGTWGLCGWFCGGVGSSCHPQCPWTSQPGGREWFYGLPWAPHTAGLEHNIPSRYSSREPGCTHPWKNSRWREAGGTFRAAHVNDCWSKISAIVSHLKVMILGCLSLRRCLISVSLMSRTFFTATSSPWNFPRKTAPWAPLPTHCRSEISSKGTSHDSVLRRKTKTKLNWWWKNIFYANFLWLVSWGSAHKKSRLCELLSYKTDWRGWLWKYCSYSISEWASRTQLHPRRPKSYSNEWPIGN